MAGRGQMPMMQPQVIVLKEGTDTSQGVPQLLSNISACQAICDTIRTTLGPRGMDKLIVDSQGRVTISNDGATIMKLLDVVQPAARTLVDIARAQDAEVGDGTTSVVLLAGELLKEVKDYVDEGVSSQIIIKGFRKAADLAINHIKEIAIDTDRSDKAEFRSLLEKCAGTSMNSKLIGSQKEFFTKMVVDAVMRLDQDELNEDMIGMKKIPGGAMQDSVLVDGVAFKKSFSYAGFEQQPKSFDSPKIVCLNVELELKAEKDNAEVRVDRVSEYQAIVDAEWKIIFDKLDSIVSAGANVVLSRLPIGDLATQYFADRNIFCAGRVSKDDLERVCVATGCRVQSTTTDLTAQYLGTCERFEECQIGGQRFNVFKGCPQAKTCTIILRGGAEQFIDEVERSLHDSIMVVRRAVKNQTVVAGGGAIEMELSRYLRETARQIEGKQQLIITAAAKALEVIPRQLCENAGFDTTDFITQLRARHAQDPERFRWYGVDIEEEAVADLFVKFVWEPAVVKINAIASAVEAACLILSVDETVTSQKSQDPMAQGQPMPGRGRGRGMPMGH
ncbi:T-complex protein 1 subunit eta [Coemansia thaxteri]|uniref:T-complex protein 1 subunit eta n=1 Tax=Coemansia thaxteri TaxID=2663907 RepID=A0A9W8BDD5_9FUNG|nr:T-complex protein 1 subunit eta [Coemansia thaxteri]KAJ2009307.1 T-complex protein 1 subunit eta [Coemansia thaxteri]KAJ2473801.1 T-complex protein 1 subunit eta [Coemansia sp. RSA 2322]KAJ2486660.1 T-complex protein 1 subunit eta [Coemansia sp. RSA 2320]